MRWYSTTNNNSTVPIREIPLLTYTDFFDDMCTMLADGDYHCVNYFAVPTPRFFILFCLMARDSTGEVLIASHTYEYYCDKPLSSLTARYPAMHCFEREITESQGIRFSDNPWDKPLRFPADRIDRNSTINNYPFYTIDGTSLHEVNVGPIHAGIIEPGVFRFICNGETIVSLEIVLGFQHRGVEKAFIYTGNRLRQTLLSENIAGDSAVSHTVAFSSAIEALLPDVTQTRLSDSGIDIERAIAIEMERIAMHLADTGALCSDIGYQLGQVSCEALRTITINTTQMWCGNRFGKGLIRPGGSNYRINGEIADLIRHNMSDVAKRYAEISHNIRVTPSILARFEDCGIVTTSQMQRIGGVGMAARASGLCRDIRQSHPWGAYKQSIKHTPITFAEGDVMARANVRMEEVKQSVAYIFTLLDSLNTSSPLPVKPDYSSSLTPDMLSYSLVEGWRGEICHTVLTSSEGAVAFYKIADPSIHNWTALSLAVRGHGISDFPICNKSFNLSYCGHDL